MKKFGFAEAPYITAVEPDMKPKAFTENESFSTKVFKATPLIGDLVISDAALEKMHSNVKYYIDSAMVSAEKKRYQNFLYEQVAIVVVNYAKKWNSNEEGKFSRYIAMQFGYRDDSGKIWRIITEALDVAFNSNNRFFIRSANGERQFYETVMAHSFGPADSWIPMIDLLFKFYVENLDCNYVPGDPLFAKLVSVLRKYFDNTVTEDDKFLIASNYYHLKIGIRRLTQERPGYCAHLFEQIVRRIHQLIHNENTETKRYSLSMVDNWFINRISKADAITERSKAGRKKSFDIALDYSKISAKYILSNGVPALRIPAIRLIEDTTDTAVATLYIGENVVSTTPLTVRGNELGRTLQGKSIVIPLDLWTSSEINCRLIIRMGDSIIFDSDKTLLRQILVFSDNREINPSKLKREKYQIYAIDPHRLQGVNVDFVPFVNGMCEAALHKNFTLEYAGNAIAFDSADVQGIRIVKPTVSEKSVFSYMGEDYLIVSPQASLRVYYSDEKALSKYCVRINGEVHAISEYVDEVSGNRAVVSFGGFQKDECVSIALVDLVAGTTVFNQRYIILPEYRVEFDQPYYIQGENYTEVNGAVTVGDQVYDVHTQNELDVSFEYLNGFITVDVPCVRYEYGETGPLFQGKYLRAADLTSKSRLKITNQTNFDCVVLIGDVAFQNETLIQLDWINDSPRHNAKYIDIAIEISGKKTPIGKVLFEDKFVAVPKIVWQDNTLAWDGGVSYVGAKNSNIVLSLSRSGEVKYSFPLYIGEPIISGIEEFVDGEYLCKITSDAKTLAEFVSFIGDERKARFAGRIITINQVTEDVDSAAAAVKVKTVYIDQIKYVDTCYVETEDDVFDVYTGCMYWINYSGEKRYFSFKYNDARGKYKVNPVKIIYISGRYLRIVNEDDEGIFYFNNEYSANPGNEITDVEPSSTARGYHDILFYLYTVDKPIQRELNIASSAVVVPEKQDVFERQSAMTLTENNDTKQLAVFKDIHETVQDTVINASPEERILVNAGPGTGKTWTLIERIIHLIQEGVDPEAIQVLCFSRAAVEVVRQRMETAISDGRVDINSNKVDIRTFDSFATQLLYWIKESDYNEISSSFKIESLSYEERIVRFTNILRAEPQLIEQCEHLIVDEVQDLVLSRAEMVLEIIKQLPTNSGVTLFGDVCQAIYDYQVDEGMSSTEFYNHVQKMGGFLCYSFTKNYRQISELQDYCIGYRNAILDNNIERCNQNAAKISEDLPECTVMNVRKFQEDTLDRLIQGGNLGILTRSNAQALIISSVFRKKNISHVVQRRLAEDALNGWIALLFNQSPIKYYNEMDFVLAFETMCSTYMKHVDPHIIWDAISDVRSATTGRLSAKNLLLSIKNKGRCPGVFTEIPTSEITISTIHRSKGREYDSVILLSSLLASESDKAEEHRVNYVALSRAKSKMYKVELDNAYFRTLENRRCYSVGTAFKTGSHYLRYFEVGKRDDLIATSYADSSDVQRFIRENNRGLIGKEAYLRKEKILRDGSVVYSLVLKENDMVLATTSQDFSSDLCEAIRQIKNLPNYARVYEQLFPARLTGIYITDIASEIGIAQGQEKDVVEHDGIVAWNTLLLEGYAKAEF